MPSAPLRALSLTRSERKVLADLQLFSDDYGHVVISSRQLVQTTGLTQKTVFRALERLADRRLIQTYTPRRPKTCEHTVLFRGSVRYAHDGISKARAGRSAKGGRA